MPHLSLSRFLHIDASLKNCLKKKNNCTIDDDNCFLIFSPPSTRRRRRRATPSPSAMVNALVEVEQEKNIPIVIHILSALLKRTVNQNDQLIVSQQQWRHPPSVAKAFSGFVIPTISIRRYLEHIFLNTDCSSCCYIIAFIYLDRFLYLNPSVRLNSFNVHRFFITAILTSVKFMDKRYYGNTHFAYVGGIDVSEMNELEVDFLFGLHFNLNVNPTIYSGYCSFLLGRMSTVNIKAPRIIQISPFEQEDDEDEEEEEEEEETDSE